jgi:hypothetical protein
MSTRQPRHSQDEFARRGDEIYDQQIRPTVEAANRGKFVAIDIDTGAFEIDADDYMATERLLARLPDAQIWLTRVGDRYLHRIGGGVASKVPRSSAPSLRIEKPRSVSLCLTPVDNHTTSRWSSTPVSRAL